MEMKDFWGVEKLREISNWSSYQKEHYFDGLNIAEIIELYSITCDYDSIDEFLEDYKAMYPGGLEQLLRKVHIDSHLVTEKD